jgi:hypothetical protein
LQFVEDRSHVLLDERGLMKAACAMPMFERPSAIGASELRKHWCPR